MLPPALDFNTPAWLACYGILVAGLLLARLAFLRFQWSVVFWLPLFVATLGITAGLAGFVIVGTISNPMALPGVIPFILLAVIGGATSVGVWFLRPKFKLLKRRYWIVAWAAVPVAALVFLYLPIMFSTNVTIECEFPEGHIPTVVKLQRLHGNEVETIGPAMSAKEGKFLVVLDTLGSYKAKISAPGFEERKINFYSDQRSGKWSVYTGSSVPLKIPLSSPGTVRLDFQREVVGR